MAESTKMENQAEKMSLETRRQEREKRKSLLPLRLLFQLQSVSDILQAMGFPQPRGPLVPS